MKLILIFTITMISTIYFYHILMHEYLDVPLFKEEKRKILNNLIILEASFWIFVINVKFPTTINYFNSLMFVCCYDSLIFAFHTLMHTSYFYNTIHYINHAKHQPLYAFHRNYIETICMFIIPFGISYYLAPIDAYSFFLIINIGIDRLVTHHSRNVDSHCIYHTKGISLFGIYG